MKDIHKVPSRYDWSIGFENQFNKDSLIQYYIRKELIRTNKMFKYNGLPDTIPKKDLEYILQTYGCATIAKVDGKLYAFRGGLGGPPNPYYLPTISVVANPALKFSKTLEIDKDCVVMLNDSMYMGLLPVISRYAYLNAECDISFKFATINARIPSLIHTKDDNARKSAKALFKHVEEGDELGLCIDGDLFSEDNLGVFDYATKATPFTDLIELKQYLKGSYENDIGIQAQFNMKREAINESEATLSEDTLFPTIDNMLEERQLACERINAMFGTNISVELDSVWKETREQRDVELEIMESQIENNNSNDTNESEEENESEQSD